MFEWHFLKFHLIVGSHTNALVTFQNTFSVLSALYISWPHLLFLLTMVSTHTHFSIAFIAFPALKSCQYFYLLTSLIENQCYGVINKWCSYNFSTQFFYTYCFLWVSTLQIKLIHIRKSCYRNNSNPPKHSQNETCISNQGLYLNSKFFQALQKFVFF